MADYKSIGSNQVKVAYSFGGRVSLANIADIRSLATRLGIPNDAKVTINNGTVEFEYYFKSVSERNPLHNNWTKGLQ